MQRLFVRHFSALLAASAALALLGFTAGSANAQNNFTFNMVPTLGTESCVPAKGRVTISPTFGLVEQMHVEVSGLPKNTDFALFIIQIPTSKFGLSWYMGDMLTDAKGVAVEDFVGRFSKGTFIVAPGVAPAPVVFPDNATKNPQTAPVQLYHLGLWFNSPDDANKAGCGDTVTPFNSIHHAGVQILNTSNFPPDVGPLRHVKGG